MPNELEYVVKDAMMLCDKGAAPDFFTPTHNTHIKINGCKVSTVADIQPLINIPEFKVCAVTQSPCVPKPTPWQKPCDIKVKGQKTLLYRSCLQCAAGGKIEFVTSGQVPLPKEVQDTIDEQNNALEEQNQGVGPAGFWEGMIPIWGSGRDLIHHVQNGQWGWAAFDTAMLAWDVLSVAAGVVSFGLATAAMQGAKTGVKSLIKAGAKVAVKNADNMVKAGIKSADNIAKSLVKLTTEAGQQAFKQAIKKTIDDAAKAAKKVCVFACFPVGTKIAVEDGLKNIEDIQIGDFVWAYDEITNTKALKEVVSIMESEVDATLKITVDNEIIETTVEHPFYTQNGWKKAADLTTDDFLITKEKVWLPINSITFLYDKQKVYNFEVETYHTYFVGLLGVLVHNNAIICDATIKKAHLTMAKAKGMFHNKNEVFDFSLVLANGGKWAWDYTLKSGLGTLVQITNKEATQIARKFLGTRQLPPPVKLQTNSHGVLQVIPSPSGQAGKKYYHYNKDFTKRYRGISQKSNRTPGGGTTPGPQRMNMEELRDTYSKNKTILERQQAWEQLDNLVKKSNRKNFRYDWHIDVP